LCSFQSPDSGNGCSGSKGIWKNILVSSVDRKEKLEEIVAAVPTPFHIYDEKGIRENAKDSDLFICEGMYGEKEKAAKAVEYKHMTFYEAAELAKEANVGEMWLTHYSPSLTKPEHYMNDVKKIFPRAKAGKDGMSVDLMFED